ncbi:MAG: hypothetical protein CL908_16545 [Deltaproteobacteria bacterium]|nr:hypothetical protein [Deltaproteobacteria bacterium]
MKRIVLLLAVLFIAPMTGAELPAPPPDARWELSASRVEAGSAVTIYVEAEKTPGRPAFRIETAFSVAPVAAAVTLMEQMVGDQHQPGGQRRKVLERGEHEALVYTFIDLPLMLSDRELALRIRHTDDTASGVHRVDWKDANEVLPPESGEVLRLSGTNGYWEFRPDGAARTLATYMTQAEVGGSIPSSISNRMMRAQALNDVTRLRGLLEARAKTDVASPPAARDSEAEALPVSSR